MPHTVRSLSLPLLLVMGALIVTSYQLGSRQAARAVQAAPRVVTPAGDLADWEQATIELYERCSPSVVYIRPLHEVAVGGTPWRPIVRLQPTGTGSGVVWDEAGHIVTNYHVVAGAQGALVTLSDHSTWEATKVHYYPAKDIAVLTVEAPSEALEPIAVGSSRDLRVVQSVFAIGNPFGLDTTLTHGLVSALGREIDSFGGRSIQDVIQTDAAINPGNSGGPLLDSSGRVIGINTQIYSPSGSSAGIGFAVPVDDVRRVVQQLIENGRVIRPGLGVVPGSDREILALKLQGVPIASVGAGGAADRAGLQGWQIQRDGRFVLGDVILKVDDSPTPDVNTLLNTLERYEVGQTVTLTVQRDGGIEQVPVTLQALD
jgi:S1-C subfamily serine protease